MLFSTAETHPRGTFFFTDYEIVGVQFGYAPTDALQFELTWFLTLVDVAAKFRLVREEVFRLAAIGAFDVIGLSYGPVPIGRLGLVAQGCFDRPCRISISLNAMGILGPRELVGGPVGVTTAGLIVGLVPHVSLLAESGLFWSAGVEPPADLAPGSNLLLDGGLRLWWSQFGIDLGVIPGSSEFLPWIPWVSFTIRSPGHRPR